MKSRSSKVISTIVSLSIVIGLGILAQMLVDRLYPGSFVLDFSCAIGTLFSAIYVLANKLAPGSTQELIGWQGRMPWFKPGDKVKPRAGQWSGETPPVCEITRVTDNGFEFSHKPLALDKTRKTVFVGGETWRPDQFELVQD